MNKSSSSKRPKLAGVDDEDQVENNREKQQQQREEDEDQVEALVTLIDYRAKEVDHLHKKANYYRAQMEEAERSLKELQSKLARLQSQSVPNTLVTTNDLPRPRENGATVSFSANDTSIKLERKTTSPQNHVPQPKPQLLIPAIKPKTIPPDTRVHPVDAQVSIPKQAPNLSTPMSQVESWIDLSFATGGSDHAVILWHEKENGKLWKPETVHKNLHSSAVNGVGGLQQKRMIISVGALGIHLQFGPKSTAARYRHYKQSPFAFVFILKCDTFLKWDDLCFHSPLFF